ncbi:flagellar type III secretion system protein FlhB [uncultured Sphingomonas sp.]|uniref:flagellar type III secretion system protein FlhB n=1 Tax=uncultured Sphingomonas sp. TaxID=158754 RepID=UPI0025E8B8FC|nr:flagellar type III secretion system protein FlhB [uncultured Sphingomonas sp.]
MSDAPDRDQQTEAPTGKRLREAAQQGDVLQSRELGTALVVMAGAAWIALAGPWLLGACERVIASGLTFSADDITGFDPMQAFTRLIMPVVMPLVTLFALTLVAAIGTPALLGSLGFRWSAIGFKPAKINPLSGIKRIFGPQGLIELGKSIAKIIVLGSVAYWLLKGRMASFMGLGRQDIVAALGDIGHVFTLSVLVMSVAMLAIAGVDIPMQLMQRTARLRMTKQQVRDEHKESEGSPEMKGHIKSRQRQLLSSSARKAVKEATVILTNPTHFAVALRYRPGFDAAPIVLAKGKDEVAQAMRELADENAVPRLSYPQLTRAIYYTSRAGEIIREDLYIAVATVLAFVFNIDRAMAEGVSQPQVDVPAAARFDENGHSTAS